jgi:RNA polymerase sigma-70 factor (ECF subfamily)
VYFHSARAELLRRLERIEEAGQAYERALACEPALAERSFLERQLATVRGAS